jgi:hypothetical protein
MSESKLTSGPLRNGDASGVLLRAVLADGKVTVYSVELPTEQFSNRSSA